MKNWKELKEFANGLTQEQLDQKINIIYDDEEFSKETTSAEITKEDLVYHKSQEHPIIEDFELESEVIANGGKIEDYKVGTQKGTIFLYCE